MILFVLCSGREKERRGEGGVRSFSAHQCLLRAIRGNRAVCCPAVKDGQKAMVSVRALNFVKICNVVRNVMFACK